VGWARLAKSEEMNNPANPSILLKIADCAVWYIPSVLLAA
jgi:hypothetical protein